LNIEDNFQIGGKINGKQLNIQRKVQYLIIMLIN